MAQNRSPAFFAVAALLLLAAAAPLALAQVPTAQLLPPVQLPIGQVVNAIQIIGKLRCTPTGICPGGHGLAGVNYTMSCRLGTLGSGSGSLVVARGVTGINGGFTITLSNVIPLLSTLGITVTDLLAGRLSCQEGRLPSPIDQVLSSTQSAEKGDFVSNALLVGTTFLMELGLVVTFIVSL